jgi:hypothetical protein
LRIGARLWVVVLVVLVSGGCSTIPDWWVIKEVPVMYSEAPVEELEGCPGGYEAGCREASR